MFYRGPSLGPALPPLLGHSQFHFAGFLSRYFTGVHFFDIHPPLARLLLAASAKLGGYVHRGLSITHIGQPYGDTSYVPARAGSAFFGAATAPAGYDIARTIGLSRLSALLLGIFLCLDQLLVIESRLILVDSQLAFFAIAALAAALRLWRSPYGSGRRFFYLIATAVLGGAAVSSKWTGAITPLLIAMVSATGLVFPVGGRLAIWEMAVAGASAIAVYVSAFYVHFKLLPLANTDDHDDLFMSQDFQSTLIGNKHYDPSARYSFPRAFVELNKVMLSSNAAITTRHPWESTWREWPLNLRGILYAQEDAPQVEGGPDVSHLSVKVYLIASPFISVFVLAAMAIFVIALVVHLVHLSRSRGKGSSKDSSSAGGTVRDGCIEEDGLTFKYVAGAFFMAGYILNLLPFMLVTRCTFLYHYIPAYLYGMLATAVGVDLLPRGARMGVVGVGIVAAAGAFGYWAPWVYGTPIDAAAHEARQWLSRWD